MKSLQTKQKNARVRLLTEMSSLYQTYVKNTKISIFFQVGFLNKKFGEISVRQDAFLYSIAFCLSDNACSSCVS